MSDCFYVTIISMICVVINVTAIASDVTVQMYMSTNKELHSTFSLFSFYCMNTPRTIYY